ncbi:MAG: hypothetical protein MUD08_13605 [Cytophagales bacterium]|nr:hypothetical protein [Cytophagales bacterium]
MKELFVERGFILCQIDKEQAQRLYKLFEIQGENSQVEVYKKEAQGATGVLLSVKHHIQKQETEQIPEYYLCVISPDGNTVAFSGRQIIENAFSSLHKLGL